MALYKMLFPTPADVAILESLFLDAAFPIIYTLARSLIPFPCLECNLQFPSHSCQQLTEEEFHKAVKLASIQLQQHILEIFSNINDILKWELSDLYKDISLGKFLSYFLGQEPNAPTILTQLPLNTDWIDLLSARMITHKRSGGGPDLILPEETTHDYWVSDEHSSNVEDEDNDSNRSMFGDLYLE